MLEAKQTSSSRLEGFGRTPSQQALENLAQALRALDLAPKSDSELCPHPLTIVRAEIENARRYLDAAEPPRSGLSHPAYSNALARGSILPPRRNRNVDTKLG